MFGLLVGVWLKKNSFATKSLQIVEKMLSLRKLSDACFAPAELASSNWWLGSVGSWSMGQVRFKCCYDPTAGLGLTGSPPAALNGHRYTKAPRYTGQLASTPVMLVLEFTKSLLLNWLYKQVINCFVVIQYHASANCKKTGEIGHILAFKPVHTILAQLNMLFSGLRLYQIWGVWGRRWSRSWTIIWMMEVIVVMVNRARKSWRGRAKWQQNKNSKTVFRSFQTFPSPIHSYGQLDPRALLIRAGDIALDRIFTRFQFHFTFTQSIFCYMNLKV